MRPLTYYLGVLGMVLLRDGMWVLRRDGMGTKEWMLERLLIPIPAPKMVAVQDLS